MILLLLLALTPTHNSIGRICNDPNCAMCNYLHTLKAHGIDAHSYQNSWALHDALHNPKITIPKKLGKSRLPFEPTPKKELNALIQIVNPNKHDIIYDPGCGDARLLIALCKGTGARGVGFEINKDIATLARNEVKNAGLADQIKIWNVDSRLIDMSKATVIVMYLFPDLINQIDYSNARIACSYIHAIKGVKKGAWYVYRKSVF